MARPKAEQVVNHQIDLILHDIAAEVSGAVSQYPPFNSPHEGYSILHEELDELWEEVKVKQANHDLGAMRKEAIQVAAMATRFILDLCPAPEERC